MPSPDDDGAITRRLLMLQRISFLSELSPVALFGLAEHAKERSVSRGQAVPPSSQGALRFFPDGSACEAHAGAPCPGGFALAAPDLVPWLAEASFDGVVRARSDGSMLEVPAADLSAALEDEFSLYLAIASATAREIVATQTRTPSISAPAYRFSGSGTDGPPLTLVDRVLLLRDALPFARDHVGALVQLARHATELRCAGDVELWREGGPADHALFVLRGSVNAWMGGRNAFTLGPGTALGGLDVLARSPRWFTATSAGPLLALVLPVDRFIDVLEDRHELAREVLRALARKLLSAWSESTVGPAAHPARPPSRRQHQGNVSPVIWK